MAVKIEEFESDCEHYKFYEVTIYDRVIKTIVTASHIVADRWIKDHLRASFQHDQKIAGLDIEWRPSFTSGVQNPVATLQICVHKQCLIFQIDRASYIPKSLYKALSNTNISYCGVKICDDAEKLYEDYDLEIGVCEDVAELAADVYGDKSIRRKGMKSLVRNIIGEEMDKPEHIRISKWDAKRLTRGQVKYACVDAYYSYKLGSILTRDS